MSSSLRNRLITATTLVACAALAASSALAGALGTPSAHVASAVSAPPPPVVASPNAYYTSASVASGGVALRNRTTGVIHISGLTGAAQAAWLYVAVLIAPSSTAPTTLTFKLHRLSPTNLPTTSNVTAKLVKVAGDPCWASGGTAIYRAPVNAPLAGFNGLYQITLPTKGLIFTNNTGADPWAGPVTFPNAEGASLVIVGTGSQTVAIYDSQSAEFSAAYTYSLTLPSATGASLRFDTIGADGQVGGSTSASAASSGETVSINGTQISGPGAPDSDSDWNGTIGGPLPQLWDDTAHTFAINAGTSVLNVTTTPPGDCLVAVANVATY